MIRALITGITGQDGGYLAEQLTASGSLVHGVVRPGEQPPAHLAALGDRVMLHQAELLDGKAMAALLADAAPDEVYNLAGVSSVALSWQEPVLTAQVNGVAVALLLGLLRAQQEATGRPVRLVQASSAEIFAGTNIVPQHEQVPLAPRSPYGASKAFAHHLVQSYRASGLYAANVVLYNHESPRRPTTFVTRKITRTAAAIARGRADELVLGNLDARRDWGWAPDYVDALVRAARQPSADDFVVATGVAHSVRDFVAAAFARAGISDWRPYVRTDQEFLRPVDAADLTGCADKARRELGWAPTVPFDEIIGRMVDADLVDPLSESEAEASRPGWRASH
jgi:GDPmannose 4,6-dehydratase